MSRQQAKTLFSELSKTFHISTCWYVKGKYKKGMEKERKICVFSRYFYEF